MKKTLHSQNDQFLLSSKGQLIGWGASDVKNLIANANRAKTESLNSKERITIRDAECIFAYEWLDTFVAQGVKEEVIKKLNSRIAHVRYHHVLMHSARGMPYWRHVANADQIDDPELAVAYGVAHLLAIGSFVNLKRCRMRSCQNFFIGRPDSKWCSKSCGSKYRVSQKRKRDRS